MRLDQSASCTVPIAVSILLFLPVAQCWVPRPFSFAVPKGQTEPTLAAAAEGASSSSTESLVLPIFPTRKSARFPSEFITLNLYEERYLSLAEQVLENAASAPNGQGRFGAIYSSDKGQVVTENGAGPIVPLLEVGDVGTLFHVQTHEEGHIPTRRSNGELRRRIRLEAVGVTRFRIQQFVHKGFQLEHADRHGTKMDNQSAFIVAQVTPLVDDDMTAGDQASAETLYQQLLEGLSKTDRQKLAQYKDWERKSFAMASMIMDRSSSVERVQLLKETNLLARLAKLQAIEEKPKFAWLKW